MRPLILLACTALSAIASEDYKLVWSDEFDKAGPPDPAKWGFEKGMLRNNEKQFYTDRIRNARVEDGKLVIEAHKEVMEGGSFTSASLNSRGHGEWTCGRFEVKAKIPAARGTWPAIWMLPTDIGKVAWPKCGEIDIMEHVGYDPDIIHGTLHTEAYNHIKHTQRGEKINVPTATTEFHIYSAEWTPERIIISIDGKAYGTFEKKQSDTVDQWPFDKPFYLILNLAIGGDWGGQKGIDDAAFPQRMEVDYVRVYQQQKK
ncbi:glycoside hydrolase family 16 protein [Luteolibacter yonseiensis]|uniref:Glycoside hydrolase family 16 protein n=1 Tax=Luteolibacter yonseiensis TaxID=1144680 RepID=A0A934V8N5_9BACT|nr:glycoside hydrolase family 16 protein [Luteolibacter yonseiensis]MBK1817447.1 glycoside hydrolase family 16 protein [Luteolibacter yonseiensis]